MMAEWWNSLDHFEMVFWYIAIPSTVLFVIQMGLTLLGGHGDGDVSAGDLEIPGDAGHMDHGGGSASFQLFSVRNVIIFFTVFSWAGIVGISAGWSRPVVLIFAFALGLAVMALVAFLFYSFSKLTESGTENIAHALGATGTVYFTIPEQQKGFGKVQISFDGRIREVDAMTSGEVLPTGTAIKVAKVVERKFVIVERFEA